MTENHEENIEPSGTSRRDFLRKSAVAGGMVWAAPTIMSLNPAALASEHLGSPFISGCVGGDLWAIKYNVGTGVDTSCNLPGNFSEQEEELCAPTGWDATTCLASSSTPEGNRILIPDVGYVTFTEVTNAAGDTAVQVHFPDGVGFTEVDAKAGGQLDKPDGSPGTLVCDEQVSIVNQETVEISLPDIDVSFVAIIVCVPASN